MLQNNNRPKLFWWIVSAFLLVPLIVSVISTIHVINFFGLSNTYGLALTLAIAFELGALSALAGLIALDKISKNVVWFIFVVLTFYQMMGNTYFAYDFLSVKLASNPDLIKNWTELFGLMEDDSVFVKRIISIISGAILPIVSLSFLDLSVDYIQKSVETKSEEKKELSIEKVKTNEETHPSEIVGENTVETTNVEIPDEDSSGSRGEDVASRDEFEKFIEQKKVQVQEMREPTLELLNIFYKGGEIKKDDELLTYSELLEKIERSRFTQKKINFFLTLCNYLDIFKLSGTQRIALKSYEEAKQTLSDYLTIGEEN